MIIPRASLFLIISLHYIIIDAKELENSINMSTKKSVYNKNLFEGDLKLPKEMIAQFYNFSSLPEGQRHFAEFINNISTENSTHYDSIHKAAGSKHFGYSLWRDRIVKYALDTNLTFSMQSTILNAVRHWQNKTCLIFGRIHTLTGDYILFTDKDPGCFTTYVGRRGGQQIINLQRGVCDNYGVVLHEIGHAVGFWHEQARPDRDQYIQINTSNIKSNYLYNFLKIMDFKVDNQGSNYDYGSLMHYDLNYFTKDSNYPSMVVSNASEYQRQGNPVIGQLTGLSEQDIVQTNRLYSCPCQSAAAGVYGNLSILIRYGINLTITNNNDLPHLYVLVYAIDCNGFEVVGYTRYLHLRPNLYTAWNEWLVMGVRRWQFFRISVWDDDYDNTKETFQLTMVQTVIVVSPTRRYYQKHCKNSECKSYIVFDYEVGSPVFPGPKSAFKSNIQTPCYILMFTWLSSVHILGNH